MGSGLRVLDWPPVWLIGFLALVRLLSDLLPGLDLGPAGRMTGAGLVGAGLGLMGLAVVQMTVARTTVIPRRDPARLVTGGVFAVSRNPIYLGDALVLAGACLWWGMAWLLPVVALFGAIVRTRFITGEEARLEAGFGEDYRRWAARTGRWFGRKGALRPRN